MAAEKKDKVSNDREMELYELHIFYLEKEESVQEFLNRLPSTMIIKEEIDTKKGKPCTCFNISVLAYIVNFLMRLGN